MSDENIFNVEIEIPFPTNRLAEIAFDVLRVEQEPKRSRTQRTINIDKNILKTVFTANNPKSLRVSINGFFTCIQQIGETVDCLGGPISDSYSHYA